MHDEILDIANSFHNFCIENKIEYFLCGGTLLGAIRHNGFIPWDDDFDVALPRKDYQKLIESWNNQNQKFKLVKVGDKDYLKFGTPAKIHNPKYRLEEKNEFSNGMPKYSSYGIFIDIFPMDRYPNNFFGKLINFCMGKLILGKQLSQFHNKNKNIFKRCVLFALRAFPYNLLNFLTKKSTEYLLRYKKEKIYGYGLETPWDNLWIKKEDIYPLVLKKFEGKFEFFIPANANEYLKQRYGDYMKIPKKSERHHHIESIYSYKNDEEI